MTRRNRAISRGWALLSTALLLALAPGASAPALAGETLRVGTSGDYAPFSRAEGQSSPEGFDIALLQAWAEESGRELEWVRFAWPALRSDLAAGRFDLAASGVTVRPERSAVGRFTVPLTETGAFALARTPERWSEKTSLDRPQIRIAVNAGGHLERVARRAFPHATLLALPDNAGVPGLLAEEAVDAVVTDSAELPHWEAQIDAPLARIGPLTRDRKAWLVRADRPALAAELDAWLLAREADGRLAAARAQWLSGVEELESLTGARTAEPLLALLAAMDERLELMPLVGFIKRRDGLALEVPEREARVIESALENLRAAAETAGVEPPDEAAVGAFFRAQMAAAKAVQWRAVKDDDFRPAELPDLDDALRPALLRIGARIAQLLLTLPTGLEADAVGAAAARSLRAPYLEPADRESLAEAIAALR